MDLSGLASVPRVLKGLTGEIGTLLGPTYMNEWLIIREQLESGVRVGYASPQELQEVTIGLMTGVREPRSIAELKLKRSYGIG